MAKKEKNRAEYAKIECKDEIKRLNRIVGQVEGIGKMLDEQRKLEHVLAQCKAVHSGLRSIESRILNAYLDTTLDEISKLDKKKDRAEKVAELETLFKQAV